MVIHLFIGLILISAASMLVTQGKRRKIWSLLLLVALGVLSCFFVYNINEVSDSGFIYQWLPYSKLQADFNISASARTQNLLSSLVCLLIGMIILNIIDYKENYSLNVCVLNLLSFISMILLISSHDMFQLMFASALLSILCFYIPNDILVRRKLFVYCFLAEVACFTALSVAYSSVGSISLQALNDYASKSIHKDFVAALLLFALGIKTGLFLFNGHYNSLINISFNRLSSILVLSLPFSALILLAKLSPLISTSSLSLLTICWLVVSAVVSAGGALAYNNINRKIIALSQMIFSGLFYLIYVDNAKLYTIIPQVLIILLLSLCIIYYIGSIYQQKAENTWQNYRLRIFNFVVVLLGLTAVFYVIAMLNLPVIYKYAYVFVLGIIIKEILFEKTAKNIFVTEENIHCNLFYPLGIIATSFAIFYIKDFNVQNLDWKLLVVLGVSMVCPAQYFVMIGKWPVWNQGIIEKMYDNLLVVPLKLFGRILWLAVDFVFIERGIIASSASGEEFMTERLRLMQNSTAKAWLFWISLGIIGLTVYAGVCAYD